MFGSELRAIREKQGLLLRQVAALLEIDTATLSKIERGVKNVREEHLLKLSEIYKIKFQDLKNRWLADRIWKILSSESKSDIKDVLEIIRRKN